MKRFLDQTAIAVLSALISSLVMTGVDEMLSGHLGFTLFRVLDVDIQIVEPF